jgi:hypothetical protein
MTGSRVHPLQVVLSCILLIMVPILAACGGDSNSTGGNAAPTRTPTPTPTAAASCPSNTRELDVINNSSQPLWVSGGGGALRSICVISTSESCLSGTFSSNGTCSCGTASGTLACPGSASASGNGTNGGENCYCTQDLDCGPGAGCNLNTNLCYYTLPLQPPSAVLPPQARGTGNCQLPATRSASACPKARSATMAA